MKLGIISDIHGNNFALKAILEKTPNVDLFIFLGDISGYYSFTEECVELLKKINIVAVKGNHDQILIDCLINNKKPDLSYSIRYGSALLRSFLSASHYTIDFLLSLPDFQEFMLDGNIFKCFHGAPWNPLTGRVYPNFKEWNRFMDVNADVILLGHTHYPFIKKLNNNKLIINPGSVGQPRDIGNMSSYIILDTLSLDVKLYRTSFDIQILIDDSKKNDPDISYLIEILKR